MLLPNVIVHAFLAYMAASSVSAGLRVMEVKYVVLLTKTADLLIPITLFLSTHKIPYGTDFSYFTAIAYLPSLFLGLSLKAVRFREATVCIVILVCQSLVNHWLPRIIASEGRVCDAIFVSDNARFLDLLVEKMKEEIAEYLEEHSIEELADVVEVFSCILLLKAENGS